MGVITEDWKVKSLSDDLGENVIRRFREVAKREAEEIADFMLSSYGADIVCEDIDESIDDALDLIESRIVSKRLHLDRLDSFLLGAYNPSPERFDVDYDTIDEEVCEVVCDIDPEEVVDRAVKGYAFELWKSGIRRSLRSVLRSKCRRF